jgi:hypothetical protein
MAVQLIPGNREIGKFFAVGEQDDLGLLAREPINSVWSADVRFGAYSGLHSDVA